MKRRIINLRPSRGAKIAWGAAPFVAAIAVYFVFSALRLAENPNDKLLPGLSSFGAAIQRMAFDRDMRKGMSWTGGRPLFPEIDGDLPIRCGDRDQR